MPGWNHDGAFKSKKCRVCSTEFKPRSGVHQFCSEPCKGRWKYISGWETTERQYEHISGNWRRYFSRLRSHKNRKSLTVECLLKIYEGQGGRCALSGIEMTCLLKKGELSATNASIDRIIPGGSYTPENVQLVCAALNKWRGCTPLDEFRAWCKAVAEYGE